MPRGPGMQRHALPAHFLKMVSHCCVAHLTDSSALNWPEAFKASEGYNNPCFANLVPKPMPILSNDPTSTPHDKLSILQESDQWSAIPGYPGPATPATDEIYYAFIINDMMAKAATGQLSAEDSVKWATQQCETIFKKWAGKA